MAAARRPQRGVDRSSERRSSDPIVLGAPIRAATLEEAVQLCDEAIQSRRRTLIGVVNAAKLVNMRSDAALRKAVLAADVIFADGMSVVWAARRLGHRLPERVAGIDLMTRLMEHSAARGYRCYLLGATQDVLDEVVRRAQQEHGVRIAGARNGYFDAEEEPSLAREIADSGADILFAAMSSPKKELFLARWADELNCPVLHGVGGAFDVMAGKVKRAPATWQRLGLEWLYRVLQEPGRLWRRYLVTNSAFCWWVGREWLARRLGRGPSVSGDERGQ